MGLLVKILAIMQNSCRENFGKFGELNVIHQYFTQPNLALINMALLKFFQVMKKQPDLPDSVIGWQRLMLQTNF